MSPTLYSAVPAGQHRLTHPKYRPDIDGLRAVAVLFVVAFHAFPSWFPGGFIGVDIFFVISGYLISSIIFSSLDRGVFSFGQFYERRIKRIFPALLLVLASCYAFGWFTLFADEYRQLGKHLAGGAFFVSNVLLWGESGYFDHAAEVKPLLHLWSLGIEEQFYIFWPLLVWAAWKFRLNIFMVGLLLLLGSFGWNISNVARASNAVFYLPHARIWELLLGAFLAYLQLYGRHRADAVGMSHVVSSELTLGPVWRRSAVLSSAASIAGILMLSYGAYAISREVQFPGWWAVIPTGGAVLLILAGPDAWINRYVLSQRVLVWFGLISFPLYLWHWPLLSFARIIESEMPSREIRIAAVLLSIMLAWLTYRLIEQPLRKGRKTYTTSVLIGLMLAMGGLGYVTFLRDGLPHRGVAENAAAFMQQFDSPNYSKNERCLMRYPFSDAESYGWWFCSANRDEAPSLILLGNSFANHLYAGLINAPQTGAHSILSIGACPLGTEEVTDPNAPTTEHPCSGDRPYRQALFINKIIEDSASVRYAIVDGLGQVVDDPYIQRVSDRITFLEKQGVRVIIFIPHIAVARDLKGCFYRPLKSKLADCELPLSVRKGIDKSFAPLVAQISAAHPDVKFFDQNEVFCGPQGCSLILDGLPIYGDQFGHYSAYASAQVAKRFIEWAQVNAPGILLE